jgi:hypothetical protein
MTLFEANLATIDGCRAIELSCKLNPYDRNPRIVKLIERQRLTGITRLPFAYQFVPETPDRREPMLVVMAAPGVSVVFEGYPDSYLIGPGFPMVEIYRIQNPEILPPLAADLTSLNFIGSYETGDAFLGDPAVFGGKNVSLRFVPENAFKVDRWPDALLIKHYKSQTEWIIDLPSFSSSGRPFKDAAARIAYEIDPTGDPLKNRPLLKIVKTPAVSLKIANGFFESSFTATAEVLIAVDVIYEVDDINDIPPQGAPIVPQSHWRQLTSFKRVQPISELLAQAAVDVGISAIPVVGDIADIAEFAYGIATGKDKWGNELSTSDLILMGIGALLPFVGAGAFKAAKALAKTFGDKADSAARALKAISDAKLDAEDAKLIEQMQSIIMAGKRPTDAMLASYADVLKRIRAKPPLLEDFINTTNTGFTHIDLEEAYQAYKKGKVKADEVPLEPRKWALAQKSGAPRRILETLLGADYAKRTKSAIPNWSINLGNLPRPAAYTEEILKKHFDVVFGEPKKLLERLEKVLEAEESSDPLVKFLARRKVTSGHFRIMKGNVAEIFSLGIQKRVLTEIAKKHPGAKLISGIRMRVMEKGKLSSLRLFTDNVIAIERKGGLEILAVFEVKAGYKGGQEATEQVFEWVERIIEDGSQLVLPKGATMLAGDGTSLVVKKELSFTYKPKRRDTASVTNLLSADRHVITAKGASHLGLDSSMRTAKDLIRKELDLTAEELDYLCGRLLGSISIIKGAK